MRAVRIVLAGSGILLLGWGAWLMLDRQDLGQLFSAGIWLVGVVVVHDGLLAALSIARHRLGPVRLSPARLSPARLGPARRRLHRSGPVHEPDERPL